MVIKVKEITIGRSRKWSWDFGNTVGYTISVTVEGTTAKDTVEEMRRNAMNELLILLDTEQERCRNVYDIAHIQEDINFKEALDNAAKSTTAEVGKKIEQFKKETLEVTEEKTITTEAVLMDPNEVTIMAKTDLSLLVTKKGFQKWIPFSLMPDISKDDYNKGEYIEKIVIKEDKRIWFNEKKSWDKLEVRKS